MEAEIHGTTFSGHPFKTTLMNTIHVILFMKYICKLASIGVYRLHVSGDDVLMLIKTKDITKF